MVEDVPEGVFTGTKYYFQVSCIILILQKSLDTIIVVYVVHRLVITARK